MKNLVIIIITCLGLVKQNAVYPYALGFLIISELEIVHTMLSLLWKRVYGLIMLVSICVIVIYLAAFYRFLDR